MSTSNHGTDPLTAFLLEPRNLSDVLRIIERAEDIRKRVEDEFWLNFRNNLDRHVPSGLATEVGEWKNENVQPHPGWNV